MRLTKLVKGANLRNRPDKAMICVHLFDGRLPLLNSFQVQFNVYGFGNELVA